MPREGGQPAQKKHQMTTRCATFAEWYATCESIQAEIAEVGVRLKRYPREDTGLTAESSKDATWFADMRHLEALRTSLQRHTRGNLTRFRKELRALAQKRRAEKGWL